MRADKQSRQRRAGHTSTGKERSVGHEAPRRLRAAGRRSAIGVQDRNTLAIVYVRTATVDQESATAQRALEIRARELGWPPERIRIIEDIGYSGLSDSRPGFRQVMDLLKARLVGLILVRDIARIGRAETVVATFLSRAIRAGVLVSIGENIVDATAVRSLFMRSSAHLSH